MSTEEYYHVFDTILFAAVLTLIVQGWAKMYNQRHQYQMYWAFLLGSINFSLLIVWKYWLFQSFAFYPLINTPFDFILLIFVPAVSLLIGTHLFFPESYEHVDLRQHMIENRFWLSQQTVILTAAMLYHTYLTSGLKLEIILAGVFGVLGSAAFVITKRLIIFEVMLLTSFTSFSFFLFQDVSYYQMVR